MKTIGIDAGSLNTKVVVLDDGRITGFSIVPSGDDCAASTKVALNNALTSQGVPLEASSGKGWPMVATGIGAKSLTFIPQQKSITTCLARGIHSLFSSVRMSVDMGAESTTVIKINERGRLADWVNHDKCASGTGLFLQQMAKLMAMPITEMAQLSLKAQTRPEITSTCAVFAESEVISHVHRDPPTPMPDIAAGIYYSVVSRVMALCKRVGIEKDIAVTGGVALNIGLVNILEKELGIKVLVPVVPQTVAALGAAVIACENAEKGIK
jgi:predicted CoA-substrate-specific enzyme activase